ncbi:MAG: heme exporter protein CcmD [Proteobacteria bacterium]|uniref:heme exporter protein CcmD n=1 Tax=Thauera sp. 2A1 TaxID=2570191 RepID=UPI0012913A27|nr:heme exporter protein CcmD [Thauera sp. 2A1]KAI5915961.1 heme exporter protein CcmD [Thauera sp. 2A1]MBS0511103.1 heme exporter protein CcmD [Pseudomonadota bacterium]MBS0552436.1 heme exporter protein CcmD [Pseudomonadota bacterium]
MQWESWSAFWNMGGAGFFVWGSYGLTFALVALELVLVFQRRKDTVNRLLRWRKAVGRNGSGVGAGKESPGESRAIP